MIQPGGSLMSGIEELQQDREIVIQINGEVLSLSSKASLIIEQGLLLHILQFPAVKKLMRGRVILEWLIRKNKKRILIHIWAPSPP
jgi:hypothetical protein